jgi:hypothetical protein
LITSWHKPACVSFVRSARRIVFFLVPATSERRVAVIFLKQGRREKAKEDWRKRRKKEMYGTGTHETYPSEAKDEFLDMDLGDMSSSR